jgi:hypothetical protein
MGRDSPVWGASAEHRRALREAAQDFRRDMLEVAKILLTPEERKEAGLEAEQLV